MNMNTPNDSQDQNLRTSSAPASGHQDIEPQDPQPESGFIDREERMTIRQSSPMNPRVNDKPEVNQEEA